MASQGVERMVAVPVLLGTAGHMKQDIPRAVARGARATGTAVTLAEPFGCHANVVRLSKRRTRQAVRGGAAVPGEATCVILVARGSSDPQAARALETFVAVRRDRTRFAVERAAFLIAASPLLADALQRAGREGWSRVVVQPHLLFEGAMVEQVARQVAEFRAKYPRIDTRLAPHLGPAAGLADALIDRATAAGMHVGGPRRDCGSAGVGRVDLAPDGGNRYDPIDDRVTKRNHNH